MANKIQKFCLLARNAGEYILYQLSSNFVQMKNGETLQQKADEVDQSISSLNTTADELGSGISDLKARCTVVENRLDNVVGMHSSDKTQKAVSVPSGKGTSVQSFSLPPGKWLIIINMWFASNKTGYRCSGLYNSSTAPVTLGRGLMTVPAISGGGTCFVYTRYLDYSTKTTNTNLYIKAYQNSGSALNVQSSYTAIRLQ